MWHGLWQTCCTTQAQRINIIKYMLTTELLTVLKVIQTIAPYADSFWIWILLTLSTFTHNMFSTCSLYRDRQNLLMGHNPLLLRQIARDLLHASSHRHYNIWHGLWWTSLWHGWEQVSDMQIASELSKQAGRTLGKPPTFLLLAGTL